MSTELEEVQMRIVVALDVHRRQIRYKTLDRGARSRIHPRPTLAHYVIWKPPLPIDSSSHWFMMQIGMMLGFVTSWPVNRWLLRHGIKEPMPTF